jgi:predicted type IV restriction endonuclease
MATIPAKVQTRLADNLKKFQPIVESAKSRDVNESDTVVFLTGILSEVLGFDKYSEITTELAIKGSYCDLALKVGDKIEMLIEVKAVGIELKEQHVKQAVDYAANKGLDWVILTNGVNWKVYKILFTKPIQNILVADINFLNLKHKNVDDLELLYLISREGVAKKLLEDFYTQKQATNRFMIGNLLSVESVVASIRKELKTIYPDIKVTNEEILTVLNKEVIKRELLEGEEAIETQKKIQKALKKKEKAKIATITTTKLDSNESSVITPLEENSASVVSEQN